MYMQSQKKKRGGSLFIKRRKILLSNQISKYCTMDLEMLKKNRFSGSKRAGPSLGAFFGINMLYKYKCKYIHTVL